MTDTNLADVHHSIRRSTLLSMFGVIVFIISLLYSAYTSYHITKENKEMDVKLKQTQHLIDSNLQQISLLTAEQNNLRTNVKILSQRKIPANSVHPQIVQGDQAVVAKALNSLYYVGVSGLNVDTSQFNPVNGYLKNQGYTITNSVIYPKWQNWLPRIPTVFYYDIKTASIANLIADDLTKLTRYKFVTQKGAGLGVIKGQEAFTFKVDFCLPR